MSVPRPLLGAAGNPDGKLGIHKFLKWWVVTVSCDGMAHDAHMITWCKQQFDYVDLGMLISKQIQEFWFKDKSHAQLFWLTWG